MLKHTSVDGLSDYLDNRPVSRGDLNMLDLCLDFKFFLFFIFQKLTIIWRPPWIDPLLKIPAVDNGDLMLRVQSF